MTAEIIVFGVPVDKPLSPETIGEIYEKGRTTVFQYAARRTSDPELADDATQYAFAQLVYRAGKIRDPRKIPSILCEIAHNYIVEEIRKQHVTMHPEIIDQLVPSGTNGRRWTEVTFDNEILAGLLEAAIAAILNPDHREAVRMKYRDGHTIQEIADLLSTPERPVTVNLVKQWLHRGRKQAIQYLEAHAGIATEDLNSHRSKKSQHQPLKDDSVIFTLATPVSP